MFKFDLIPMHHLKVVSRGPKTTFSIKKALIKGDIYIYIFHTVLTNYRKRYITT